MDTILVTGAGGYVGRHIIKYLLGLDKYKIIASDLRLENVDERVTCVNYDILTHCEDADLYEKLGKPDICIHLAWSFGFDHSSLSHIQNIAKHFSFLTNIIGHGCRDISVMGTMHEIGYHEGAVTADTPCNPLSYYGIAKNTLRQSLFAYVAKNPGVSFKWLRAYYILGDDAKNNSIFAKILELAKNNQKTFPFTDGKNKYDFIDINDLAKAISLAATQKEYEGIINCSSGIPVAIKDQVSKFISDNNLDIKPEYGAFPSRKYDSPAIWGDAEIINKIINK